MNASTGAQTGSRRPLWRQPLLVAPLLLTLLAGGWLGLKYSATGARAAVGSGYVAHVVCSCRYVGNRDMASCATDLEPGMEIVSISDDPEKRRVTASVPLLAKRTATYDPEYGCALDTP
ncbi:MAG: hypothetical protein ACOYLS_07530 [Polymorphobacter sp.]